MIFSLIFLVNSSSTNNIDNEENLSLQISKLLKKIKYAGSIAFDLPDEFNHLNIIVIGKCGAGKSTLINSIFRKNFVQSGVGKPITDKYIFVKQKNFPLRILDTPGLEITQERNDKIFDYLLDIIDNRFKTHNPKKFIHCIWYCISCASHRIEDDEFEFLAKMSRNPKWGKIPVILILTQCVLQEDIDEMMMMIEEENLNLMAIVPILAKEAIFEIKGKQIIIPSFGLPNLIKSINDNLPSIFKSASNKMHSDYKSKNTIFWNAFTAALMFYNNRNNVFQHFLNHM